MGFCPNCKFEYEAHIRTCPDCHETLVEKLPEPDHETKGSFVALPDVPGRVYADMVKGALEAQGIPCYIRAEGIIDAYGISGTGPASKGARVFVPADRLDECLEVQCALLDHI